MSEAQAIILGVGLAGQALATVQAGIAAAAKAQDQAGEIAALRAALVAVEGQLIAITQAEANHIEIPIQIPPTEVTVKV